MQSFAAFCKGLEDVESPVSELNDDAMSLIYRALYAIELRPADKIDGVKQIWMKDGQIHRDFDLPACVTPTEQTWYQKAIIHRDGKPAKIFSKDGKVLEEKWFQNGELHRDDGPADIQKFSDGFVYYQGWYQNGKLHRVGGPAIRYFEDEHWFQNGLMHRDDGPAMIIPGRVEEWWINGKMTSRTCFTETGQSVTQTPADSFMDESQDDEFQPIDIQLIRID